ncbi:BgTH12-06487 [Blumeria graminis f. sp. triticale]|uniref:BgTH12-06487 n=1 Tax=Blumeria graminis f. sp. triticale TaxID=1689686 RepID=A0A9W4GDI9_BLUGR|nr:BgTH12-06487 [Blumeria graminis f. sp. triticale]
MISCAFIFILRFLNPNKPLEKDSTVSSQYLEHLVIIGSDGGRSFYAGYDHLMPNGFPVPDLEYDLFATFSNKVEVGTNTRAYCSKTISAVKIAEILDDIVKTDKQHNQGLVPTDPKDQSCLDYMQKLLIDQDMGFKQPLISATTLSQEDKCSSNNLIRLAYRGLISVSGAFDFFAPQNDKAQLTVVMDKPTSLVNLMYTSDLHGIYIERNSNTLLLWYFGRLHIFKKYPKSPVWYPVTQIGSEKQNSAAILKFIRNYTGMIQKVDKALQELGSSNGLVELCRSIFCWAEWERTNDIQVAHISSVELRNYPDTGINI